MINNYIDRIELSINQIFQHNGIKIKVIDIESNPQLNCEQCYYFSCEPCIKCENKHLACSIENRSDKKNVVFIEYNKEVDK